MGTFSSTSLGPEDVSQRLRQLGRLKHQLNDNKEEKKELIHYITGAGFDEVIASVKSLAGFHRNEQQINVFGIPSLALRLEHNMVKCAEIKRGLGIRKKDDSMKDDSDDYLKLHTSEWTNNISSIALATLKPNTFNTPVVLPVTSDLE